jgi:hypothetical protein
MDAPTRDTAWLDKHFEWMLEKLPGARLVDTILADGRLGRFVWVPLGAGLEIPAYFEYTGRGPFEWTIHVGIDEYGRPYCIRLICDGRVTPGELHTFPLGRLIREGAERVARPDDERPHPQVRPVSEEEATRIREAVAARLRMRPKGHARLLTDEYLAEVARVYRDNIATGKPSKAVAEHFRYRSEASARRVVSKARSRGLLGPTSQGRVG